MEMAVHAKPLIVVPMRTPMVALRPHTASRLVPVNVLVLVEKDSKATARYVTPLIVAERTMGAVETRQHAHLWVQESQHANASVVLMALASVTTAMKSINA
jgi:protein subunit release factor B